MAQDPDAVAEKGREVAETLRTPGFAHITAELDEKRQDAETDRKDLVERIGAEGEDAHAIALQVARLNGLLEGLASIEDITSLTLHKKEGAEKALRS